MAVTEQILRALNHFERTHGTASPAYQRFLAGSACRADLDAVARADRETAYQMAVSRGWVDEAGTDRLPPQTPSFALVTGRVADWNERELRWFDGGPTPANDRSNPELTTTLAMMAEEIPMDPTIAVDIPADEFTFNVSGGSLQLKLLRTDEGGLVSLTGHIGAGMDYDAYQGRAVTWGVPTTVDVPSLAAWCRDNVDLFEAVIATWDTDPDDSDGSWYDPSSDAREAVPDAVARAIDCGEIKCHWTAADWLVDGVRVGEVQADGGLTAWAAAEQQRASEAGALLEVVPLRDAARYLLEQRLQDDLNDEDEDDAAEAETIRELLEE